MTDKEYRIEMARIKKLIKKWVKPLGLGWWSIKFEYDRNDRDDSIPTTYAPKANQGKFVSIMTTSCDPYYLQALVECYLPQTKTLSDSELEHTFLHELMHIYLSPMHHKATAKEEELVATQLANAFVWIREEKP